jgi:DNA processing protein
MSKHYLAPGLPWLEFATPTPYGTGMSERLACDLAARGLVVFGGLAQGVGSAAHSGAIATKGETVAIFGTGADVVYPKRTESRWINYFR